MSRRKKNKNKYKHKNDSYVSKPSLYSQSSSNPKDIHSIAFKVFGSLYYTSKES